MQNEISKEQMERLLHETQFNAENLNKLNRFMGSDEFPKLPRADKKLLYKQQRIMSRFVEILGRRLERAGRQFEHKRRYDG